MTKSRKQWVEPKLEQIAMVDTAVKGTEMSEGQPDSMSMSPSSGS